MKTVELPLVEIVALASTRGMLGAGLALLLGEKLSRADRRMLGMILTTIGGLTTAPLAYDLLRRRRLAES